MPCVFMQCLKRTLCSAILLDLASPWYSSPCAPPCANEQTWAVAKEDGILLADVDSFVQKFESYALQRSMGQQLLEYAQPAKQVNM